MQIKVVGRWLDGMPKECLACRTLRARVDQAIKELRLEGVEVQNCESQDEFDSYGVVVTPLLVVNGKIRMMGRVPTRNRIKQIIAEEK